MRPDPESRYLLTPTQGQWLQTEIERWAVDCAEFGQWTELHPIDAALSSYLQTGPLDTTHTDLNIHLPNTDFSHPSIWNAPMVALQWQQLTGGRPATVNKLVVTSDWQGQELSFDIWPPPRPSANAVLHFAQEPSPLYLPPGIQYTLRLLPTGNPNHLHITIPSQSERLDQSSCGIEGPPDGEVCAKVDRTIVDAFLLWWQ